MTKKATEDRLLVGNCLDTLKTLADDSIDSIVTDPPYEIGFMGKGWDSTGIAYSVELWKECLRVLKPGGHLLSFGATRSYHRMAVAIEDAGFEIRDSIHWTYGSGFPKSMNISKAIDKAAKAEREVVGKQEVTRVYTGSSSLDTGKVRQAGSIDVTAPATEAAKKWNGWGTALKPSHEPIVVARKPINQTVADNVQLYGTGAINIDATRVGTETITVTNGKGFAGSFEGGTNDNGNTQHAGRFPANTLLTHNHDCQLTGTTQDGMTGGFGNGGIGMSGVGLDQGEGKDAEWQSKSITIETYTCTPNCPIELLDQQSGLLTPGHWTKTTTTGFGEFGGGKSEYHGPGEKAEKGGASRFFHNSQWSVADDLTPFIYQAKPGKKERNAGLDGLPEQRPDERTETGMGTFEEKGVAKQSNFHPTVKPVELMRYLIKMVTPPNGVVLDPFLGSGTTAVAATLEGYAWKGCELTADYLPIIKGRITWAVAEKKKQDKKAKQLTLEEQE